MVPPISLNVHELRQLSMETTYDATITGDGWLGGSANLLSTIYLPCILHVFSIYSQFIHNYTHNIFNIGSVIHIYHPAVIRGCHLLMGCLVIWQNPVVQTLAEPRSAPRLSSSVGLGALLQTASRCDGAATSGEL